MEITKIYGSVREAKGAGLRFDSCMFSGNLCLHTVNWRIARMWLAACFSEGGGLPASSEGGWEEEAGERAAAHPGGAGETAEEEGTEHLHRLITD